MSDGGNLIPISDEQAKAAQEALKTLQGLGGFLKEILGTVCPRTSLECSAATG
jgi:hypothetical protein